MNEWTNGEWMDGWMEGFWDKIMGTLQGFYFTGNFFLMAF